MNAAKIELIEFYDRTGELHMCTKAIEPIFMLASIDPSWYEEFLWHVEMRGTTLFISPIINKTITLD
jgi:hypothetical protein